MYLHVYTALNILFKISQKSCCRWEMDYQVKALDIDADNLNSSSKFAVLNERTDNCRLFINFHMQAMVHVHPHTNK